MADSRKLKLAATTKNAHFLQELHNAIAPLEGKQGKDTEAVDTQAGANLSLARKPTSRRGRASSDLGHLAVTMEAYSPAAGAEPENFIPHKRLIHRHF